MRLDSALVALLVLFLAPAMVMGQQEVDSELATQWEDFVHYVTITSRPDLAVSFGNAILASDAPAHDLYVLSRETENVEMLLSRAANMNEDMAVIVLGLRERIEEGYREYRADPEAIADAIDRLSQSGRAAVNGMERLRDSGEYALPQLISRLSNPATPATMRNAIVELLPQLGKEAVLPLTEALQTEDPAVLEVVASSLGRIGYAHAVPRLREVLDTRDLLDRTRVIVERAIENCGGEAALQRPLAELCYSVGEAYYDMDPSLLPDSRYELANVWYWEIPVDEDNGRLLHENAVLIFSQVPREIFCDIYAMRMAQLALEHDADFYPAVSLWLAADTRREANLPAGQDDAVRTDDQPTAAFYMRAAGAQYAQEVLQRALDDYDSRVAIPAIEALAVTAGAESLLLTTVDGSQPLVEALLYPDRRVRYLAAWAIANALPQERFTNHDVVISVLSEAIRQNARRMALVIISDEDERNATKDVLRAAGYEVIDNADPADAMGDAYEVGGVDLVVVGDDPAANVVLATMRQERLMAATPVLIARMGTPALRALAEADGRVVIADGEITEDRFNAASREVNALALSEPMTRQEMNLWTIRAAEAIRGLGLTDNPVFNINRARPILALALAIEDDDVQIAAAAALAVLTDPEAQADILGLAMTRFADQQVRVSAFGSLAESIRRFGNHLNRAHAQDVLSVARGDYPDPLREAAAQVLGAMALPSQEIESLIVDTPGVVDSARMLEAIEAAGSND
jgi:HEAT repeat protein